MGRRSDPETHRESERFLALLRELDQLEDLLDDMDELGIETRSDLERRIAALHEQVDALDDR